MIKLIILDVDGVLLGTKKGLNSPYPSIKVMKYLREIQDSGVPISLCTGKASFATKLLIEKMQLNNHHITDGGAVVFDPIDKEVLKNITLPGDAIQDLLKQTKDIRTNWELYTLNKWFVPVNSEIKYAVQHQEHSNIIPFEEVDDLMPIAETNSFTKAMILYLPETEEYYRTLMNKYEGIMNMQWTEAPSILPNKLLIITAKGVNKKGSVNEMLIHYNIKPEEVLAVGDTMMDWKFMDGCGYFGVMGNADKEMKDLVTGLGGFIGGNVDEDGVIDIIEHFKPEISLGQK
jgi:hypothetical protein